jgi:hypothetical protein
MGFKQCLDTAAGLLGDQIPGKDKATYTKHFLSGVMCEEDALILPKVHKDKVKSIGLNCDAKDKRGGVGGSTRVWRLFPEIPVWSCIVNFAVLDDAITQEIFERTLTEAGRFVGVGRFRPGNGGMNGRFHPESFEWSTI